MTELLATMCCSGMWSRMDDRVTTNRAMDSDGAVWWSKICEMGARALDYELDLQAFLEGDYMTDNGDVLLQQTEDGHHKFVKAPERMTEEELLEGLKPLMPPDGTPDPLPIRDQEDELLRQAKFVFVVGAQVELKSGGPVMTVFEWRLDDVVEVNWFIGGTLQRDAFHWQMLKLAGESLERYLHELL